MNFVEKAIDEFFFQKTGSKLIPSALDRVMNGFPVVSYNGREINLEEARNNAKDEMVRNIIDGVTQTLGEQIGFTNKLIFAGGVMQDEYISKKIKAVMTNDPVIIENSQFANALGMLEVAKAVELKEAREGKA
jgi:hydrogenase maturation factor HypF (carbamoyltransferase family)